MDTHDAVMGMLHALGEPATSPSRKEVRMQRAENLFKNSTSLLLVPIIELNPTSYHFFFADMANPSLDASFSIKGALTNADQHRNMVCFTPTNANYDFAIGYAAMLTFLGLDVYFFSANSLKELSDSCPEGEVPSVGLELFDPSKPPELLFILTKAHFKEVFGVDI